VTYFIGYRLRYQCLWYSRQDHVAAAVAAIAVAVDCISTYVPDEAISLAPVVISSTTILERIRNHQNTYTLLSYSFQNQNQADHFRQLASAGRDVLGKIRCSVRY